MNVTACRDPSSSGEGHTAAAADTGGPAAPEAHADPRAAWSFTPAPTCEAPTAGLDRLTERGAALGLRTAPPVADDPGPCAVIPGIVVAADLDGDGAEELIFNHGTEAPLLARREGRALVERRLEALAPPDDRPLLGLAAADLNGDGAIDLIGLGEGYVVVATNDGRAGFTGWEPHLWQEGYPRDCLVGIGLGDIDGDGDLDASLPGLDRVPEAGARMGDGASGWVPSEDRLLRNDDGQLVVDRTLQRGPEPGSLSLVHLMLDRDNDGDQDIIAYGDRATSGYPPASAWRNDGPGPDGRPVLVDEAEALGLDSFASAMGVVAADLNDDGVIDLCVSDTSSRLDCRLSHAGAYYEGALTYGLAVSADAVEAAHHGEGHGAEDARGADGAPDLSHWTGWGLAYLDVQNDGYADIAAVAGPPPDRGSVYLSDVHGWQPDWLWAGTTGGRFSTAVGDTGFHRTAWGYGLVSVDLFGDGSPELIVGRADGPPEVWDNPCGAGAWVTVALDGPPGNPTGIGAQVEVEAGGRRQLQLMLAQTGTQQHSQQLHFGLGDANPIARVRVRWPDGTETTAVAPPARGLLRVRHPDS